MFEDNYPPYKGDFYSLMQVVLQSGHKEPDANSLKALIVKRIKDKIGYIDKSFVPANEAHKRYLMRELKTYQVLPPLYKTKKTRWGDEWNGKFYPEQDSVASAEILEKFPVLVEEAYAYNWICYVELA